MYKLIIEAMKRSASELALEFMRKTMSTSTFSLSFFSDAAKALPLPDITIVDPTYSNSFHSKDHHHHYQACPCIFQDHYLSFQGTLKLHSAKGDNLTPKRSTLDPQSSICGNNPKAKSRENEVRGATSASSPDHQSDNEETDVAQSEQSLDPSHLKRLRRMLSNRESARRSRKRKQEHLTDLEFLAEQLRGENHSLYRQLTNAHQQFRDADTSNRVLKSDVEALRAKVKLAEDVLARGSLPCGLNQLVQTQLTSPQTIASHNHSLGRVANVSPTITIHGDVSSNSGLTISGDISNVNANLNNGTGADAAVSCVSEIWR
ncbi:hypothetical protein V6Z12_D07G000700 [Gossypium hirsutum]